MNVHRVVGALLVASALPLLVVEGPAMLSAETQAPVLSDPPPPDPIPAPEGPDYTFTESDVATANAIATKDPLVESLAPGQQEIIEKTVPWFDSAVTKKLLGAAISIKWKLPTAFPTGLPKVEPQSLSDSSNGRPYRQVQQTFEIKDATSAWAFVDLTTKSVVQILPGPDATVTVPQGFVPPDNGED